MAERGHGRKRAWQKEDVAEKAYSVMQDRMNWRDVSYSGIESCDKHMISMGPTLSGMSEEIGVQNVVSRYKVVMLINLCVQYHCDRS